MRVFISINIPGDAKEEIKEIQEKLSGFYGKKTEVDNLHLTLKFLGEINEDKIELIKEKLKKVNYLKFESSIDYIGAFDNRGSRKYPQKIITWLHLTNCRGLQKKIEESLTGLFEPEKRFMSHLTIARIKKIKDKRKFLDDLKKINVPHIRFRVDEFYLMKSVLDKTGPKYEILEKYNLI